MSPNEKSSDSKKNQEQTVNFVADVHLIQILGEQLIGSEKTGILELIKNAYDAKATFCDVWIEKVPGMPEAELSELEIASLPGPVITIIDNGCGMDENTIIKGWLRPATRLKTSIKEKLKQERKEADIRGTRAEYESLVDALKREHGGRLPLGEKGVGRFATHRLGKYLQLQTKTQKDPLEWVLKIDWEQFDKPDDDPKKDPLSLGDISLTLLHRLPERDYGPTQSGTLLRIFGGREGFTWADEKLREVGLSILFLRSPFKGVPLKKGGREANRAIKDIGFDARFHCPQLGGEKFEVLTEIVPAPFICTAIVDENGKADIEIQYKPPQTLKKPQSSDLQNYDSVELRVPPEDNKKYWLEEKKGKTGLRAPECGSFTCEIKVWIRDGEWIDYADRSGFLTFLDNFGGVGIYRDGLSLVPPQVASKDDWLGLTTRHIKKGSHISYYMMSGSVDLIQENTLYLVDRTSREGLLVTRPFTDLRNLLRQIIFIVENSVANKREQYKRLTEGDRIPEAVLNKQTHVASEILKTISKKYDFITDTAGIKEIIGETANPKKTVASLATTFNQVRREVKELTEESNALLEVASYGIAIGVAVHEIEKITSNLYFGLERILKKATSLDTETYHQVDELSETAKSLLNELRRIAPLRVTRLERPRKFLVRDSILAASGAFRLSWEDLDINFIPPTKDANFEFTGSFGACSQVFANLFDNATYWLRTVDNNRRIVVQIDPEKRRAIVADSGPNIDEKIRPNLFKPFYSLKNPPSGLGLYICSYYMRQMKGGIRESHDTERLPGLDGAQFTITFPGEKIEQ
jgi:signal transduction histidine kinase